MPDSDPLALLRRYLDAVNAGDLDAMAAMTGPGFVHHSGAGDLDIDGVRRGLTYYRTAFPDLVYDVEEMLVVDGGNAVVARWTIRGTHEGPFSGSGRWSARSGCTRAPRALWPTRRPSPSASGSRPTRCAG